MRKYALVNNNIVSSVVDVEDDDVRSLSDNNQMVIDITDVSPQPKSNWILNGNSLQIPSNFSDLEKFEIVLAGKKTDFGINLARQAIDRIGARNKILNKTGTQVAILLNQMLSIKLLLETGALGTARYSCTQLKTTFIEYEDIFDYVINEISSFEQVYGL